MREALRRSRAEVKRKGSSFTVSGLMFVARQGFTDFFSNQSPLDWKAPRRESKLKKERHQSIIVGSAASCLLRGRYLRGTLDSKHL
jgi:hypothetical protein|nr:hypothetical protein Q903MT_gene1543 [Picea sitchensis]